MSLQTKPCVGVVGATGAVGREMLSILAERAFPLKEVRALASKRSAGERVSYGREELVVEELTPENTDGIDIALFSAGGAVSREFAPQFAEKGTIVIDNSSAFRMEEKVPLIVPEVNTSRLHEALAESDGRGIIIANPNCSTIQLVVVLKPIHDHFGLERVLVSTYQSASGAGNQGMDELWEQTRAVFNQGEVPTEVFQEQLAFNCIPHIDVFLDNGFTKEEQKVIDESRKILDFDSLRISATAVRVPVMSCHSEAVSIETERSCPPDELRNVLRESPGILVLDDPEERVYPTPATLAGTDATYVGRIRQDFSVENGTHLWIVADNLRKGAALNAVQIAESVLDYAGAQRH